MRAGARECKVLLCYAPNRDLPLDVHYEMDAAGRPAKRPLVDFAHSRLRGRWGPGFAIRAVGPPDAEPWRLGLRGLD